MHLIARAIVKSNVANIGLNCVHVRKSIQSDCSASFNSQTELDEHNCSAHGRECPFFSILCIGNDELTGCRSKVVNTISKHKSTDGLNKSQFI